MLQFWSHITNTTACYRSHVLFTKAMRVSVYCTYIQHAGRWKKTKFLFPQNFDHHALIFIFSRTVIINLNYKISTVIHDIAKTQLNYLADQNRCKYFSYTKWRESVTWPVSQAMLYYFIPMCSAFRIYIYSGA